MSGKVFAQYARYYDLLYRDKDYVAEALFVDGLLRGAGAHRGSLLDVGCGTGAHAREFAKLGWQVCGVDLSPVMVEIAQSRSRVGSQCAFSVGAAATFDLGRKFSAVVSLFHVASYQSGPDDLFLMCKNIRAHLETGGIFVFDFWHGPGVLTEPPAVHVRELEGENLRVHRTASPTHRPEICTVDVKYEMIVEESQLGQTERITELHRLRYFFVPELRAILARTGFSVAIIRAGMTDRALDDRDWFGLIVATATK